MKKAYIVTLLLLAIVTSLPSCQATQTGTSAPSSNFEISNLHPGVKVPVVLQALGKPDIDRPNLMIWTSSGITVVYNEHDAVIAVSGKVVEFGSKKITAGEPVIQAKTKLSLRTSNTKSTEYLESQTVDKIGNMVRLEVENSDLVNVKKIVRLSVVSTRALPDTRSDRKRGIAWKKKDWRTWDK